MVVFLVLATFMVFIAFEVVQERRRAQRLALEHLGRVDASSPSWLRSVAGFQLPEPLFYHRGHTWLRWISPEEAYVGVDDFARRLLGSVSNVKLSRTGDQLTQGDTAVRVDHDSDTATASATLLSPVDGEVLAVNPRLRKDPGLLGRDPYGQGWLYRIRSSHLHHDVSNLLDGSLAEKWMEDTWERFQHRLMVAHGSVIQDGGTLVADLGDHVDPKLWRELVDEFLELEPQSSTARR